MNQAADGCDWDQELGRLVSPAPLLQSWGYGGRVTDAEVVADEVRLGELADELGFHALWPVEHHFDDYSFCPDNTVFLAHMAARTTRILLGTGAVILPWNDPLRVAEKIALLDHLSNGRVLFGMGRGLARCEYAGFGIPMDESRDRFDESARMVLDALETGVIEGDGPYFRQPRTTIRPAPARSFRDRTYCVAMSPDSVLAAADLGARMVMFSQQPWESQAASVATYRERFVEAHGREPEPPVVCDFVYCDADVRRAGGPSIMAELQARHGGQGCPTGSAVVTSAGQLPARLRHTTSLHRSNRLSLALTLLTTREAATGSPVAAFFV